ncbi:MAG: ABC transporter [Lasallia pustulata]|uniref:ABC transporter n=1 Tax=Lasallia pustulata TaxID=136370 RepID=A0A5M8PFH7_9LECA|nr:MAG: ABC transporter [Lasallia pustulata]
MSKDEKTHRAESVLLQLNLRDCADNLIGDAKKRGISKGEKRRVTIAVQLLTDPHILILDEQTPGLDAFTATSIIDVLRSLAAEGKKTIILSIHQARSDLFKYFDHILLLARGGQPVYAGKGQLMLAHFSALGYNCPQNINPAGYALDLITIDLQDSAKETVSRNKISSLVSEWNKTTADKADLHLERTTVHVSTPAELGSLKRAMTPLRIALPLLLQRSLLSYRRSSEVFDARIAQMLGFSIIITLFWAAFKVEL